MIMMAAGVGKALAVAIGLLTVPEQSAFVATPGGAITKPIFRQQESVSSFAQESSVSQSSTTALNAEAWADKMSEKEEPAVYDIAAMEKQYSEYLVTFTRFMRYGQYFKKNERDMMKYMKQEITEDVEYATRVGIFEAHVLNKPKKALDDVMAKFYGFDVSLMLNHAHVFKFEKADVFNPESADAAIRLLLSSLAQRLVYIRENEEIEKKAGFKYIKTLDLKLQETNLQAVVTILNNSATDEEETHTQLIKALDMQLVLYDQFTKSFWQ